ncbi:MAG: hypothetical protein ABIO44_07100, partial [Saprospiraceae bacterium]
MFLHEYENFNSQYENGIKSITLISSRPRIIAYPVLGIQERNKHSNKLFFDKKGRLTQSIYWSMNTKYKILYIFSPLGKLISALKLDWQGDIVKEISEFRYDKAGRIQIERIHSNSDSFGYCET